MDFLERTEVNPENEHIHKAQFPDHWERYEFVAGFIQGGNVLDVACGPGYGSAYLSRYCNAKVIGLDIDGITVEAANRNYGNECDFIQIVGQTWPLKDGSIDTLVSLETFEHLEDPDSFLKEAKRVLKPNGKLILSTPVNNTDSRFSPDNPFHVREYSWQELGENIERYFTLKSRYSQISKLGELNSSINQSKFDFLKPLIPKGIKKKLLSVLQKSDLKKGRIIEGEIFNASVQLVVALK